MTGRIVIAPPSAFTWRRCLPYFAALVACTAIPALPYPPSPVLRWWFAAWACVVLIAGGAVLAARLPQPRWLQSVPPLLILALVAFLRGADGSAQSGFSPLVFLPVVWFAVYGRRRELDVALVGSAVVLILPILVVGAPQYPPASTRGIVLLLLVLVVVGVVIANLVESERFSTNEMTLSEQRFRAAFDDAPLAIALASVVGSGRFLRVNRAMCAMFGRSAEDLTSRPVDDFTHPDDLDVSRRIRQRVNAPGTAHRLEKRYLHSSGRTIWTAVSFSVVRDDLGQPLYLVSQFEDMTARREADRALLAALDNERARAEKLHAAEAARAELLAAAVHDLRTPLTAATGFVELLTSGDAGPVNASQQRMLETVTRSLARLDAIIVELRDRQAGERETALASGRPVVIGDLVVGAVQGMSVIAAADGHALSTDLRLDGTTVRGDADRLDRVLANLIGNALKFTPPGGTVRVGGRIDDDDVVIEITDTGIGITQEDQDKIFERFFRSPDSIGRGITGTGLGLAIVREIVYQHDGSIAVSSIPGEGSTFTVRLPVNRD